MKKSILILTADAGFGHRSAANAVAAGLADLYGEACHCTIVNPALDPSAPALIREPERNYDHTVRATPAFYRFTYQISDIFPASLAVQGTISLLMENVIRKILSENRPDAILSTYHLYNAPLGSALAKSGRMVPFFTVVTDLGDVHRLWFQDSPRKIFVGSERVAQQGRNARLPAERLVVSGIPVDPRIARETRTKTEIRKRLGWAAGIPTVLVVGSRRVANVLEHLKCIDACPYPLQIVSVAGGDDALYRAVKHERGWRNPIFRYNYVMNMPEMLRAADVLVSKAGGLITAEGMACGLPLILVDHISGQETGNVRYVCENRAGLVARSPEETGHILNAWLADGGRELKKVVWNSQRLGRPEAAFVIAEALWRAATESLFASEDPLAVHSSDTNGYSDPHGDETGERAVRYG